MNKQNININEIQDLVFAAWQRIVAKDAASKITNAIIKTVLQKDPRLSPLEDAVEDLTKAIRIQSQPVEVISMGAVKSYDLCGMPAIAFMPDLTERVVTLAKEYGVGIVSMTNTGGVDTLSTWLLDIPKADCIGIFVWNGGSYTTVPFGSAEPFFGTNPIAYAVPTLDDPLLLDMSTSEIPFMDLMDAIHNGVSLPANSGLDELGQVTTDPNRVYDMAADSDVKLVPMGGGHKGSAVMLLIEILTGALINSKMAREATSVTQIPEEFGGILAAININAFTSALWFKKKVSHMIRQIRSSRPAVGFNQVRVPGDGSYEREKNRLRVGTICLDERIVAQLRTLAFGNGIVDS